MKRTTVIFVESIPSHLKGYLDRYLNEIRSGLYVGDLNSDVASRLWKTVEQFSGEGDAVMIRGTSGKSGYRTLGKANPRWFMHDFDGFEIPCRVFAGTKDPYEKTMKAPRNSSHSSESETRP